MIVFARLPYGDPQVYFDNTVRSIVEAQHNDSLVPLKCKYSIRLRGENYQVYRDMPVFKTADIDAALEYCDKRPYDGAELYLELEL